MKTCLLVIAGSVLLFSRPAFACDCVTGPIPQVFKATDLVFSGIVTTVRLANPQQFEGEAPTVVELTVRRPWKGVQAATVTLRTQRNRYSCEGFEFVVGQEYLVFANRNPPGRYGLSAGTTTFGVSLCGGTTPLSQRTAFEREQEVKSLAGTHAHNFQKPELSPVGSCIREGAKMVGAPPVTLRGRTPPKKVTDVKPNYPTLPVGTTGTGTWIGELLVDVSGSVAQSWTIREIQLTPPLPSFNQAIVEALRQWKYEPLVVSSKPVPFCFTATVSINWQ
jgi:hypothetical protein